jgi:hypothetical protein
MKTTKQYLKRRGTAPRICRSMELSLTPPSVNSHENNLQYLLQRSTHGTASRSTCDSEQGIPAPRRIKPVNQSVTSYVIYRHTLAFSVGYGSTILLIQRFESVVKGQVATFSCWAAAPICLCVGDPKVRRLHLRHT